MSLNPCLDAILVELAEPEQILALSHYSHDPASTSMDIDVAKEFAITGGTAEEIIALSPDLVLASTFIAPATRSALERAGIRVKTFGNVATAEESRQQIEDLMLLTSGYEGGEALASSVLSLSPLQKGDLTAIVWQPGEIVAGSQTLLSEHLEWAGFRSYSKAAGLGQSDHVSLEELMANPPDVLLVAGQSRGQLHPSLQELDNTFVTEFEPNLFYCGGPSIFDARLRLRDIRRDAEIWHR